MNLIFNILLFLLIVAMLVVFFRSPKQIIVNFSKGFLRLIAGRFLTFTYDSWKESKAREKNAALLKEIEEDRSPQLTIEFPKDETQFYLFVQGDYSEDDVVYDLQMAVQKLGPVKVGYTHFTLKDAHLVEFSGLQYLSRFQAIMSEMSVYYGRDQTYGYIKARELAIGVTIDNEASHLMTGRQQEDYLAFRDGYAMDAHSNVMILSPDIELKSWVKPAFFEKLINSVKEEKQT